MLKNKDFTWRIGGEAGQGIMSSGLLFSNFCVNSGYYIFDFNENPSLIRGGHNIYTTRVSSKKIQAHKKTIDVLIALNLDAIELNKKYLSSQSIIIANADKILAKNVQISKNVKIFYVPLISLATKIGGREIMMNSVAIGFTISLLGGDFNILSLLIKKSLFLKSKKIINQNIKAAQAGFNFSQAKAGDFLKNKQPLKQSIVSGGEAISLGAAKAGLNFFACYPMTPIDPILTHIVKNKKKNNITYIQPEDEIAGINMAIGASISGARAMVATSGGGFSLMVEALGLAGITETPLVIINGQRPGPATGLPTWQGQGDLRFVLHAAQDDFPRIVLAPGSIKEAFLLTAEAFNLADIYQVPVIILADKFLIQSHQSISLFKNLKVKINRGKLLSLKEQQKEYKRYKITDSGISPRAIPGRPGFTFIANSVEHDEFGFADEGKENRIKQMDKRMKKMESFYKKMPNPNIYGSKQATITLVGWGSTKGPILEAQALLKKIGIKSNFLHLNYLSPFPAKFVVKFLKSSKNILMIEQNASAQCAGLIREKTGIRIEHKLLKYDGRQLFIEDIVDKVNKILK
ncbi:2-oxoacid:acceptor oxidoreductase subunit alpha [Patescibacteria group bacterium]|nr:2-oxoacid:acceptor oxidoreductase subunit alpha [Patescibacteria group bacterium]